MFSVPGWELPTKIAKAEKKKKTKEDKPKKEVAKPAAEEKTKEPKKEPKKKSQAKRKRDHDEGGEVKNMNNEKKQKQVVKPKTKTEEVKPATPVTKQKLTPLQRKMQEKLSGSRFRWINEQLYTSTSEEATDLMKNQPELFDVYHEGFRNQVQSWPQNPVDAFITQVKERLNKPISAPGGLPGEKDGTVKIADMGCGEAQLALDLQSVKGHGKTKKAKFEVHSFDLKKGNERITVADIKNVPLPDESVNVVVFCLALMGTNFLDFIREGLRILKPRGEIWIAEIKSRFVDNDTTEFVKILKDMGLMHKTTDDSNKMFVRFEFFKPPPDIAESKKKKQQQLKKKFIEEPSEKDKERENKPEGEWLLKPCIYKRR
ncbi:25S rRNA (adenine(645)-N(1))-methyltransferase [Trichomonascus vanleenenianus]|uniref:25S rRNA (adenine645-N1)-methyltransferase n=1 Tax=Trichomonascus vanleenenianus TaxID=2268995 RepID=UPI003ECAC351